MRRSYHKIAAALAVFALLLPGVFIVMSAPTASAATTLGRVTVSGTNILVDGKVPSEKFFGVVETTALQFAILAYIEGETAVAGKSSHLNGPDTAGQGYIPYHETAAQFWHQYFALSAYYDTNLVRLGAGDAWGSRIQYEAWLNHHDAYIAMLKTICDQAEQHGVWVCLVMAGSQEYPTYTYGGSGSVFETSSSAYSRYIAYCRDVMSALDGENAIAMYDLFNEPDHDIVATNYWNGDKARFNAWQNAVARDTAGVSTHPRTMGVAGLGKLFGWGKADFDLATGNGGFEILHRHYYASATGASNAYLFTDPEAWADACGKPLYWGELAYNGVYPLTRWEFAEQTIWAAGGQAIAPMVLTGTPGYPYKGGLLPDPAPEEPTPLPELKFTSSPATTAMVGSAYSYRPTTSIECDITLNTDASFLTTSLDGAVTGTPDQAGSYSVSVKATAGDGRAAYQNYTLVVAPKPSDPEPPIPPISGGNTTGNGTGAPFPPGNGTGEAPDLPRDMWYQGLWRWLQEWFTGTFSWGKQPAVPSGISGGPTGLGSSAPSSSGNALGGGAEALMLLVSLATIGCLVGAFLFIRRRS